MAVLDLVDRVVRTRRALEHSTRDPARELLGFMCHAERGSSELAWVLRRRVVPPRPRKSSGDRTTGWHRG